MSINKSPGKFKEFLSANILKVMSFVLIFFLISQLILNYTMPLSVFYNERPIYEVFKDDVNSIEITIKQLKREIAREKLSAYIIILGDSVGYSSPGPAKDSIARYMNDISKSQNKKIKVFNLSVPSMMLGDVYGMIDLLNKNGVSTQNLIVELSYIQFACRNPVFWLRNYVNKIDPKGYKKIIDKKMTKNITSLDAIKADLQRFLSTNIALLGDREFLANYIKINANKYLHEATYPIQPWTKKLETLKTFLNKPSNQWYYTDRYIPTDETNLEIYYLNKIIEVQKGKNTLYFLAAMNDKLLGNNILKPGYISNMNNINKYFSQKDVTFIDFNKKIDYNLFSDHIHLIPEGYKQLAGELWSRINL